MSGEVLASVREGVLRVTLKWQAAACKLGLARGDIDAHDRELFAQAWCHPEHWAAARNVLGKEASR